MLAGTQGTVSLVNGRPVLGGSFSGLDTAALVQALVDAKRFPVVRLEQKIQENDVKSIAYNELRTLTQNLSDATFALSNPPGFTGSQSNIFERKAAFLTSNTTTPASDLMGVTASTDAGTGVYEVRVLQIATAHKLSGGSVADNSVARGIDETLTIGLDGGTTADIAVTNDMTLDQIVAAINTQASTTGVRASSLKIADGDYRIVVTAEDTNKTITMTGDAGGALLTDLGLSTDNGTTFTTELETPRPAQIEIDGIPDPITRDSNEIGDAVTGLTFDLYKAEPGTTIQVEIDPDLSAVNQQITDFVNAYNELRAFVDTQREVSEDGELSETSVLFNDLTMRSLASELGTDIAALVNGLDAGALSTLRDVGIELDSNNFLTVDSATLDAALINNLDEVRGVFEFGFSADSTKVAMIARSQAFEVGDFELNITGTDANGDILGASVTGYGAVFTVSGTTLVGIEGTAFEGLTLAYAGGASAGAETIQISTSLGIAERIHQTTDDFADPATGLISDQINTVGAQNDDYTAEIAKIEERLLAYQEFLLAKYAAMEQAVAFAENITNQLRSFIESDN